MMIAALGLAVVGIGYARIKTKDFLRLHRWVMSGAVFLNLAAIFAVMFPSLFLYYTAPSNSFSSPFSVLQIIHLAIGFPAAALSLMFVFNYLPQPTKKWMQVTAIVWILSVILGAVVYYAMPS